MRATDEEIEFLRAKADGRIPVNAGWAEWKAARKLAAQLLNDGLKPFAVEPKPPPTNILID